MVAFQSSRSEALVVTPEPVKFGDSDTVRLRLMMPLIPLLSVPSRLTADDTEKRLGVLLEGTAAVDPPVVPAVSDSESSPRDVPALSPVLDIAEAVGWLPAPVAFETQSESLNGRTAGLGARLDEMERPVFASGSDRLAINAVS